MCDETCISAQQTLQYVDWYCTRSLARSINSHNLCSWPVMSATEALSSAIESQSFSYRSSRKLGKLGLTLAAIVCATLVHPAKAQTGLYPDFDANPPSSGAPTYTETQLATNGQGGFPNYRIPALTVINNGELLASYDGRPTSIDAPGPNSILQKRSTDNGKTWQAQSTIHVGATASPVQGFSDPSYIVDRSTGDIFNFHVHSYDNGFSASKPGVSLTDRAVLHAEVSVSSDNGQSWTHRDITAAITAELDWRSRFAVSGQGIQLKYGNYTGRLIQQYVIIDGDNTQRAVSVYSDDHGENWHVGSPVGTAMDENKVVELSDGRVMLNSRDAARSGSRKIAYSDDGGITYGDVHLDTNLPDPANNAAILRAYPNAAMGSTDAKVLIFSNAASAAQRANGTIRLSYDDGLTWPEARVFQPAGMAYSSLTTLQNGNIGLLYEPDGGNGGIRFASFNLAWVVASS